ncbi:FeoC-like transcriptional regulator [Leucothrix pacifica]|uniref:Transcriptional regulator HTH-type FeoC domain-containing protein n=1 Tax=Leucothrix pacifica TaxID=1247513 RepID=A0A317C706_9GAMM|nr:FeoC-like transcriptional regulator [Leucothrix pacifica]PWQ92100.1 hypothetical protein DKW60_22855 [Leucothrix pacifica]
MLLGEIRDYVKQRGSVSLNDIALHFDITPDSVQFAIQYWQRKGKIQQRNAADTGCNSGSCGSCASNQTPAVTYEWVSRNIPLHWHPSR